MKAQSERILLLRVARYFIISICTLAIIISVRTFFQHSNTRHIELASPEEFQTIANQARIRHKSVQELEVIAERALSSDPPIIELADEANMRLIDKLKNCLTCENRIVRLDLYEHGYLSERGLKALSRSYALSPYGDLELMMWRFEVSEQNWDRLDEDLRKATLRQITAMSQRSKARAWMRSLNSDISEISTRIDRLPSG